MVGEHNQNLDILSKTYQSIIAKISSGYLLAYSDIGEIQLAFRDTQHTLLFIYTSPNGIADKPSISFSLDSSSMTNFESTISMQTAIDVLTDEKQDEAYLSSRHYEIFSQQEIDRETLQIIGAILDLYYENSIIKLNIDNDDLDSLRDLIEELIDNKKYSGLEGLKSCIRKVTGLESVIATSEIDRNIISLSFNKSKFKFHRELIHALNGNTDQLEIAAPRKTNSLLEDKNDFADISYAPWSAIAKSIHFQKSIYFQVSTAKKGKSRQFIVFPIVTSRLKKQKKTKGKKEKISRSIVHSLLFVTSIQGFKKTNIDAIKIILEVFFERRSLQHRLETLEESRAALEKIDSELLDKDITYNTLLGEFKKYASNILDLALKSTSAHSITVRLYNHSHKSLELIVCKSSPSGKYCDGLNPTHIQVKKDQINKSLNAYVFAHADNPDSDYEYIPVIKSEKSTNNIKGASTKLKTAGMNSCLVFRDNTKSGICFPIKYRNIAVGTINIESSLPYAFNDLISFFTTLRDNVVAAYRRTIAYNDIRTLSRQMANQAAIHELDQNLKLNENNYNFTPEQSSFLEDLFRIREIDQHDEVKNNKLSGDLLLLEEVNDWVKTTYDRLDDKSILQIQKLVKVHSLNHKRISQTQFECILFILKNLIQNITSHGSPDPSHTNSISIDDQPLFGIGRKDFIRIYFRQKNTLRDSYILDRVGIKPIKTTSGLRHGMLLIAMITKSMGGQVFFSREHDSKFIETLIKIPYTLKDLK